MRRRPCPTHNRICSPGVTCPCPRSIASHGPLWPEEGPRGRRKIDYHQGDMTKFTLAEAVDMAAILMDSTSYLLDNDAVIDHLDCMAKALMPGGLYLLEMSHPRDVFHVGKSAGTDWSATRRHKSAHHLGQTRRPLRSNDSDHPSLRAPRLRGQGRNRLDH